MREWSAKLALNGVLVLNNEGLPIFCGEVGVEVVAVLGICGEHGGDPASIVFCEKVGLDYVSCSPFRVPIARLAAAQAVVRAKGFGRDVVHGVMAFWQTLRAP